MVRTKKTEWDLMIFVTSSSRINQQRPNSIAFKTTRRVALTLAHKAHHIQPHQTKHQLKPNIVNTIWEVVSIIGVSFPGYNYIYIYIVSVYISIYLCICI